MKGDSGSNVHGKVVRLDDYFCMDVQKVTISPKPNRISKRELENIMEEPKTLHCLSAVLV